MNKTHILAIALIVMAFGRASAQILVSPLDVMEMRGPVKHVVQKHLNYDVVGDTLNAYELTYQEVTFDRKGRRMEEMHFDEHHGLKLTVVRTFRDSIGKGTEIHRDSTGRIVKVVDLFFDDDGHEVEAKSYLTHSLFLNIPDNRTVNEYNRKGLLKRKTVMSRHGRQLLCVFYSRNHRGRLIRNEYFGPTGKVIYNNSYTLTKQGDIATLSFFIYNSSESELVSEAEFVYDNHDNWTHLLVHFANSERVKREVEREIEYWED